MAPKLDCSRCQIYGSLTTTNQIFKKKGSGCNRTLTISRRATGLADVEANGPGAATRSASNCCLSEIAVSRRTSPQAKHHEERCVTAAT